MRLFDAIFWGEIKRTVLQTSQNQWLIIDHPDFRRAIQGLDLYLSDVS